MSEIEKKLKREMDAKVPDLKEKIMVKRSPNPPCGSLAEKARRLL